MGSDAGTKRVKMVAFANSLRTHPDDYQTKYKDNPDTQNREIAFQKIFDEAIMGQQRRVDLDLYRLITKDDAFRQALQSTLKRILSI